MQGRRWLNASLFSATVLVKSAQIFFCKTFIVSKYYQHILHQSGSSFPPRSPLSIFSFPFFLTVGSLFLSLILTQIKDETSIFIILLLNSPSLFFFCTHPIHPPSPASSSNHLSYTFVLHLIKESVWDSEEFLSTLQSKQHLIPDSALGTDRGPSRVKHLPRILYHPSLLLLFLFLSPLTPYPSHPPPSPRLICLSAGGV